MQQDLGMPEDLTDAASVLQLLTVIFPTHSKKVMPTVSVGQRKMLIVTFNENSFINRQQFFTNPMIQFVWANHYLRDQPHVILQYLRHIRS